MKVAMWQIFRWDRIGCSRGMLRFCSVQVKICTFCQKWRKMVLAQKAKGKNKKFSIPLTPSQDTHTHTLTLLCLFNLSHMWSSSCTLALCTHVVWFSAVERLNGKVGNVKKSHVLPIMKFNSICQKPKVPFKNNYLWSQTTLMDLDYDLV